MLSSQLVGVIRKFRALGTDCRGNVLLITALSITVITGCLGLGAEVGLWYLDKQDMQHAADEAAIAASINGGANYADEANAVAAKYGYVNGVNNVKITILNTATCTSGSKTCYSVTIGRPLPLFFSQLMGNHGNVVVNGRAEMQLNAMAVSAPSAAVVHPYCLLALAGSGTTNAIQANGVPKADLTGCNMMSNTSATCNGHNTNADVGDAHVNNFGCGVVQNSYMPIVKDPYSGLASNIPADTCKGTYPQEPTKKKGTALPSTNLWKGSKTLSGNVIVCGDLQLTGNVTITASSGAVLVIYNGQLDTNGYTLQTDSGSGLTIVFAGASSASYTHSPTGGGTLDIAAPTSGVWSGVAIYQAPSLTLGVDVSAAGNSPTWNITGLVYLPNSSVTFSGAVNKSSNGHSCFVLVVDNITINGTGSILEHGECALAGTTMPTNTITGKGRSGSGLIN